MEILLDRDEEIEDESCFNPAEMMRSVALREHLKEQLIINKHDLDTECINQASFFNRIADECATAMSLRDKAKENLYRVDAQLGSDIRTEAQNNEIKITEKLIEQKIFTDKIHNQAFGDSVRAKLESDKWGALREAFSQRVNMVELIAKLYLAEYYPRKSIKEGVSGKTIVDGIKDNQNKKRRRLIKT